MASRTALKAGLRMSANLLAVPAHAEESPSFIAFPSCTRVNAVDDSRSLLEQLAGAIGKVLHFKREVIIQKLKILIIWICAKFPYTTVRKLPSEIVLIESTNHQSWLESHCWDISTQLIHSEHLEFSRSTCGTQGDFHIHPVGD
jgi:hypothetical protein